jgi:hypothetical protein
MNVYLGRVGTEGRASIFKAAITAGVQRDTRAQTVTSIRVLVAVVRVKTKEVALIHLMVLTAASVPWASRGRLVTLHVTIVVRLHARTEDCA